jgi:hypothetical protein
MPSFPYLVGGNYKNKEVWNRGILRKSAHIDQGAGDL